jgi:hypothetical protein
VRSRLTAFVTDPNVYVGVQLREPAKQLSNVMCKNRELPPAAAERSQLTRDRNSDLRNSRFHRHSFRAALDSGGQN